MELHSQIYHPIVELKITGKLLTRLPGRGNIATITVISFKKLRWANAQRHLWGVFT
jgi:hypothetical protein